VGSDVVAVAVAVDFAVDAGSVVVLSRHHSRLLLPLSHRSKSLHR